MSSSKIISSMTRIGLAGCLLLLTVPLGCERSPGPSGDDNIVDTTGSSLAASDFDAANTCVECHPRHVDEWSGSMHAYAMIDPTFAAIRKIGQSAYPGALDGACVQCHSPIGRRIGELPWGEFSLDDVSPITAEGIGCDLCHTITSISAMSNGGVDLTPGRTKYGSLRDPAPNTFHESEYHPLYTTSEYCGACHDFITDGGLELETTFREWRAGGLLVTGKECNECHMEAYVGPAAAGGEDRVVHRHTFPGVDVALIDFPNRPEQMELVTDMLRNALTMTVEPPSSSAPNDSLYFNVLLTNDKTGHAVPSGVPFNRQMWLSVIGRDGDGTIIFSSGQLDANDDLMDENSEFGVIDPQLFNAQAQMYRADGKPTGNTWDATSLDNPAIQPGETRTVGYEFNVPPSTRPPVTLEVVLRFRSFPPSLFRSIDMESLLPIPIIDMAENSSEVSAR